MAAVAPWMLYHRSETQKPGEMVAAMKGALAGQGVQGVRTRRGCSGLWGCGRVRSRGDNGAGTRTNAWYLRTALADVCGGQIHTQL
jgi:hypothetical protein